MLVRLSVAAVIVAGVVIIGAATSGRGPSRAAATNSVTPQGRVSTAVSREPANGATEDAITTATLPQIEARSLEIFRSSMAREIEARGKHMPPDAIQAESVILDQPPHRLAVTHFKAEGIDIAAQFVGIVGGDFIRLMCTTDQLGGLVLVRGPCADRVHQVFGVSLTETGSR